MSKFLAQVEYLEKSRQITYSDKGKLTEEYNSLSPNMKKVYDQYNEKDIRMLIENIDSGYDKMTEKQILIDLAKNTATIKKIMIFYLVVSILSVLVLIFNFF